MYILHHPSTLQDAIADKVVVVQHPRVRNKVIPKEETETRSMATFDWRGYIKRSGLKPGEDKNERNAYNQQVSDALDWDRTVPDVRDEKCQNIRYDNDLPTTSIIICFHNEGRAALLRTVVSVLNRSPPRLVAEIILVDDFSNDPSDGVELLKIPKVGLIRNDKREGLIRSRVKGADIAKGDVLIDKFVRASNFKMKVIMRRKFIFSNRIFQQLAIDYNE